MTEPRFTPIWTPEFEFERPNDVVDAILKVVTGTGFISWIGITARSKGHCPGAEFKSN